MEQLKEQMMEHLLARIYAMQDGCQSQGNKRMHKTNQAKIKANQVKMDTNLREMRAGQELLKEEMLAKFDAHERMMTRTDSQLEKMEAMDLEANPESVVEHEVPKEVDTVKPVRVLKSSMGTRI
jgi:hypothetical protein